MLMNEKICLIHLCLQYSVLKVQTFTEPAHVILVLLHMQVAEAQTCLHKCAVLQEPSLLTHKVETLVKSRDEYSE